MEDILNDDNAKIQKCCHFYADDNIVNDLKKR